MRYLLLLLLALPLRAQPVVVPCEPTPETTHLFEAIPPLEDISIPYERRVGALRALAQKHPDNFFVQRAYQDSFRRHRELADEYDRALAMYRARSADPLSRYYEARLLMFAEPRRAQESFAEILKANPKFAWPHLDLMEYAMVPGMREKANQAAHQAAFEKACPSLVPGNLSASVRATLGVGVNPLLGPAAWAAIWQSEEQSGLAPDVLASHVRADLKRIEARPFRADPDLHDVYEEAARILKDPAIFKDFRVKVEREAPDSMLALSLVQHDWQEAHPQPGRNAPGNPWAERENAEVQADREWLRRWPNSWFLLVRVVSYLARDSNSSKFSVTPADLDLIDQALRVRKLSPDGGQMYPPLETLVAGMYTAAKVRLDRVPALLDAGMQAIEKMQKYEMSPDLLPAEMRSQGARWPTISAERTEAIRVDYLLATNRPEDARPLIEQALAKYGDAAPKSPEAYIARGQWLGPPRSHRPGIRQRLCGKTAGTFGIENFPKPAPPEFTKPLPEFFRHRPGRPRLATPRPQWKDDLRKLLGYLVRTPAAASTPVSRNSTSASKTAPISRS
jgi:hypothetical protein